MNSSMQGKWNSTFYTVKSGPSEEPNSALKYTSRMKPNRLDAIKNVYMKVGTRDLKDGIKLRQQPKTAAKSVKTNRRSMKNKMPVTDFRALENQ